MPARFLMLALPVLLLAANHDYTVEEKQNSERLFAGDASLDIDTVSGFIHIEADGGNTIRVMAERIARGATRDDVERAKREVTLDINEKDGVAQLYVNGPFRDHCHTSEEHGFHDDQERHYEVTYNFTVRLPRATALRLRTVNGDITIRGTASAFDVADVNGGINMTDMAGSGRVKTLNGSLVAVFLENPREASSFQTLNGAIDVRLQPNLAADLRVKTLNGGAYTDFDVAPLQVQTSVERHNGSFVYRSGRYSVVRVGSGGPELTFETLNGEIRIRKAVQ